QPRTPTPVPALQPAGTPGDTSARLIGETKTGFPGAAPTGSPPIPPAVSPIPRVFSSLENRMYPSKRSRWLRYALLALLSGSQAHAGETSFTLQQAFELAWQQQPEAQALASHQAAAQAGSEIARS